MYIACYIAVLFSLFWLQLATDYLEGEKYLSISGVIPIIKGLAQKCAPCEDSSTLSLFKEKILNQLQHRFQFVFNSSTSSTFHMSIVTWLDPKYKMGYFKKVKEIQVSLN